MLRSKYEDWLARASRHKGMQKDARCRGVDVFFVSALDFAECEPDTWQSEFMQDYTDDGFIVEEAAAELSGWYFRPLNESGEPTGPFASIDDAMVEAFGR